MKWMTALMAAAALLMAAGCAKKVRPPVDMNYVYQVGAFQDEQNALDLKERLEAMGFKVDVEKAEVDGRKFTRVLVSHTGPVEYVYQVGSFSKKENALKVASNLVESGYKAEVRETEVNGAPFFRVFVRNENSLEEFILRMKSLGLEKPIIHSIESS